MKRFWLILTMASVAVAVVAVVARSKAAYEAVTGGVWVPP